MTDLQRLIFVVVMGTRVSLQRTNQIDPHKLLFCTLTGRSDRWWRKYHLDLLERITKM